MGITAQCFLLLLATFSPSTQELLTLKVREKISAQCGKNVTLDCEVSSPQHGLSIKRMKWYQSGTSFCVVNSEGEVVKNPELVGNDFHCKYRPGKLSLIIKNINPMTSGKSKLFECEVRSNKGTRDKVTTVELQEYCGKVTTDMKDGRPTCDFTHVYPGEEVHWFQGSKRLYEYQTTENVDKEGWLTIHSHLEQGNPESVYNCSLWSPERNAYITSALVTKNAGNTPKCLQCGAGSQRPTWTALIVTFLLALVLK